MSEVLKQMVEALECALSDDKPYIDKCKQAIQAGKKAIAELESQEPVAHLWECLGRWSAYLVDNGAQADCAPPQWLVDAIKNATAPPQRTWAGLTNNELQPIADEYRILFGSWVEDFARAIEAKLKEKNT
jgi:hypothetical protein